MAACVGGCGVVHGDRLWDLKDTTGPGGQAESPHPLRVSHSAQLGRQATGKRDPPHPT